MIFQLLQLVDSSGSHEHYIQGICKIQEMQDFSHNNKGQHHFWISDEMHIQVMLQHFYNVGENIVGTLAPTSWVWCSLEHNIGYIRTTEEFSTTHGKDLLKERPRHFRGVVIYKIYLTKIWTLAWNTANMCRRIQVLGRMGTNAILCSPWGTYWNEWFLGIPLEGKPSFSTPSSSNASPRENHLYNVVFYRYIMWDAEYSILMVYSKQLWD